MLIVAVALALNLLVVERFLHNRAQSSARTELQHEVVKFQEFASRDVDPNTGRQFGDAEQLIHAYLDDAVPEQDEGLFEVVNGQVKHQSRDPVPARLDQHSDVIRRAAEATDTETHTTQTDTDTAMYALVPVTVDDDTSRTTLVIVESLATAQAEAAQVVRIIAIASTVALVIAGAISWLVAGRILAPLRQVRRTAESISETDLTRRIDITPNSRDDVARLAVTFNGMLDRLERAFQTERAFMDDAAHELRTPLTVVRGHLELMGDDAAERAETTDLVLEEIGRMNRIVNDLLILAAAEQPDFLNPAQTHLGDLVHTAVARASTLAERDWIVSETVDTVVWADEQRLLQALAQLASNAVRHTGTGDTIRIGSTLRDGNVVLTVADTGAGVPDDLKDRVFDRFSRGVHHSNDGAGLGLAIVSAIAIAHHGQASVVDSPAAGATFILSFPARYPGTDKSTLPPPNPSTLGAPTQAEPT